MGVMLVNNSEHKMLKEVALRNAIAMFRKKNANSKNMKPAIPKVGIFWIDLDGRMYAEGVSLRGAEDYGEFKIYDRSHFDAWDTAVSKNTKWKGLEYEDVCRGRVVYKRHPKKPVFIVYMPKQLSKSRHKVLSWFGLPSSHVRFDYSDEHYRMCCDMT
jgi:hypothetical protein